MRKNTYLPDRMNNNRYKSKWIFHRLDQRDLVDLLLKDHEVKRKLLNRTLLPLTGGRLLRAVIARALFVPPVRENIIS